MVQMLGAGKFPIHPWFCNPCKNLRNKSFKATPGTFAHWTISLILHSLLCYILCHGTIWAKWKFFSNSEERERRLKLPLKDNLLKRKWFWSVSDETFFHSILYFVMGEKIPKSNILRLWVWTFPTVLSGNKGPNCLFHWK